MYEDYIQNLFGRNYQPYQNTYDPMLRNTNCYNQIDGFEQYDYEQNNFYEQIPYDNFLYYSTRNLVSDLEIESLDLVDLVAAFEKQYNFEIPDKDIKELQTVNDIIKYIESKNV